MVLRALAKLLTKQAKAMDFLALVVPNRAGGCAKSCSLQRNLRNLLIISFILFFLFKAFFPVSLGSYAVFLGEKPVESAQ